VEGRRVPKGGGGGRVQGLPTLSISRGGGEKGRGPIPIKGVHDRKSRQGGGGVLFGAGALLGKTSPWGGTFCTNKHPSRKRKVNFRGNGPRAQSRTEKRGKVIMEEEGKGSTWERPKKKRKGWGNCVEKKQFWGEKRGGSGERGNAPGKGKGGLRGPLRREIFPESPAEKLRGGFGLGSKTGSPGKKILPLSPPILVGGGGEGFGVLFTSDFSGPGIINKKKGGGTSAREKRAVSSQAGSSGKAGMGKNPQGGLRWQGGGKRGKKVHNDFSRERTLRVENGHEKRGGHSAGLEGKKNSFSTLGGVTDKEKSLVLQEYLKGTIGGGEEKKKTSISNWKGNLLLTTGGGGGGGGKRFWP